MTFSIILSLNTYNKNDYKINNPFRSNPIRHYRISNHTNGNHSNSNPAGIRGKQIMFLNNIPGGSNNCIVNNNIENDGEFDCENKSIQQKIIIPKSVYDLNIGTENMCKSNCLTQETKSKKLIRQSDTIINDGFYSSHIGYLNNRNKTYEKKTSNFLDREESIKLYGSYDKRKFFIRNSHITGNLANCAISYYKPNNSQFAKQGSVYSSTLTSRKKFNVDNLCRERVPLNEYFSGISYNISRKRNVKVKCCPNPPGVIVDYDLLVNVLKKAQDNIHILRDIINDNDANITLGSIIKLSDNNYTVPFVINNINVSQLNETEFIGLIQFIRDKFQLLGLTPENIISFFGVDGLNYSLNFENSTTRFYIEPRNLRVTRLVNIVDNSQAQVKKTGRVRIDNDLNETTIYMNLENVDENFINDTTRRDEFKQYMRELYINKFGVNIQTIEFLDENS